MEINKDNEELRKLIAENPELPLVFCVYNDNLLDGYCSTVFEDCTCKVDTVYFYEDRYTDDYIEVSEYYSDCFLEDDKYKDLSDDDYDKAIAKYIEDNISHYKAIVVSVGWI